jgi:hypothetical protein
LLVASAYFDRAMVNRQRLLWAVATRRQLERWETLVASVARLPTSLDSLVPDCVTVWTAEMEHHFLLVAARHLFKALDLDPPMRVKGHPTLREELIEGRDLHEHWTENMSIFNVTPRVAQPQYPTGKSFAARNPDRGPYWWLDWSAATGPRVMPHVAAPALHDLLDEIEAEVLRDDPELGDCVPPRAPSSWVREDGQWGPKGEG